MSNDQTNGNGHVRLQVENAYKIFGGDPEPAFKLIEQGKKKR